MVNSIIFMADEIDARIAERPGAMLRIDQAGVENPI